MASSPGSKCTRGNSRWTSNFIIISKFSLHGWTSRQIQTSTKNLIYWLGTMIMKYLWNIPQTPHTWSYKLSLKSQKFMILYQSSSKLMLMYLSPMRQPECTNPSKKFFMPMWCLTRNSIRNTTTVKGQTLSSSTQPIENHHI